MAFGRMGYRGAFGLGVLTSGGSSQVPAAPTLLWTSLSSDNQPNFDVTPPTGYGDYRDAADGDELKVYIYDNASFLVDTTDELDAGDLTGSPVEMEYTVALADGTYYARARVERGALLGEWSNVEVVTISTINSLTWGASNDLEWGSGNIIHWG